MSLRHSIKDRDNPLLRVDSGVRRDCGRGKLFDDSRKLSHGPVLQISVAQPS